MGHPIALNTSSTAPDPSSEAPTPAPGSSPLIPTPESFARPATPMADFASREDFPACTLGQHVDLGGFTGVVVQIVRQSLKVASPDGAVQSFNIVRLRRLHAPAPRPPVEAPEPVAVAPAPDGDPEADPDADSAPESSDSAPAQSRRITSVNTGPRTVIRRRPKAADAPPTPPVPVVRRRLTDEPDFTGAVQPVGAFAGRPDFPDCAMGLHLDIAGYVGVMVEIVDHSVKVAAEDGNVRRYNVQVLRKLYGTPAAA